MHVCVSFLKKNKLLHWPVGCGCVLDDNTDWSVEDGTFVTAHTSGS